jgi:small subunit ribosomal protein S16
MLVIRLRRTGRKHDPHYRIVIAEHTAPIQGKFIDTIGHYHPKSKELVIEQDKLNDWMNKGAKPSNTVAKLATKQNIKHKHIVVKEYHGKPKKKAEEPKAPAAAPAEATSDAEATEVEKEAEASEETTETVEETETPEEAPEVAESEEPREEQPAEDTTEEV